MDKSTYKLEYQHVKGNWVTYLMFLGIGLLFVNRYIGITLLALNIILTVIYKNNKENKSAMYFNFALKNIADGDVKEAKDNINEAIGYNKLNRDAYFFMGCILFDEGDYTKSLEFLKRGNVDEVKDPSLYYVLGRCYYHTENYDKAIKYLESISYEGNDKLEKERLFTLAKSYAENDKHEKAYKILEKLYYPLVDIKGDTLDYCYYRGICSYYIDKMDEAKKYINLVKEVDCDYKYLSLYLKNM